VTLQYPVEESFAPLAKRYRQRHIVSGDTAEKLRQWQNGRTLRALAVSLGYPESYAATLSGVLRQVPGCITSEGEKVLRQRIGVDERQYTPYYRPCLPPALRGRLEAAGLTIEQAIEKGLSA
jgi:hypothetical protein